MTKQMMYAYDRVNPFTIPPFTQPRPEETFVLPHSNCEHEYTVHGEEIASGEPDCKVLVPATIIPDCGHIAILPCSDKDKYSIVELADMCQAPCKGNPGTEQCGHACTGVCNTCSNGVFHERCSQPCKRILICGHVCDIPCSQNCQPCLKPCKTQCPHGVCEDICGMPCAPCEEPCTWKCPHKKCTRRCEEVCNRTPCDLPCLKALKCGHPCVGFCGEACPPLCRYCNSSELMASLFDTKTELDEEDRFVFLPTCGHTIEVGVLNKWMNTTIVDDGEINFKKCPMCRVTIWNCPRYNNIMNEQLCDMIRVKIRVYGGMMEIEKIQISIYQKLMVTGNMHGFFQKFQTWVLQQLTVEEDVSGYPKFLQMSKATAECLLFFTSKLMEVEQLFMYFDSTYAPEEYNTMEFYYRQIWDFAMERAFPLTPREKADVDRQMVRINDVKLLMDRRVSGRTPGVLDFYTTTGAVQLYHEAYSVVVGREPYSDQRKAEFINILQKLDDLLHCELGITDGERIQIVDAFGGTPGRWFKCPKGHIYVVTECGGPTEIGQCNECGSSVGGTRHMAVQGTQLAQEMDGAVMPLYPTVFVGDENLPLPPGV